MPRKKTSTFVLLNHSGGAQAHHLTNQLQYCFLFWRLELIGRHFLRKNPARCDVRKNSMHFRWRTGDDLRQRVKHLSCLVSDCVRASIHFVHWPMSTFALVVRTRTKSQREKSSRKSPSLANLETKEFSFLQKRNQRRNEIAKKTKVEKNLDENPQITFRLHRNRHRTDDGPIHERKSRKMETNTQHHDVIFLLFLFFLFVVFRVVFLFFCFLFAGFCDISISLSQRLLLGTHQNTRSHECQ